MYGIQLKSVSISKDNNSILNSLDLNIPEGKFFALLGPSGCGKTTLLRLIGGFEKADTGTIWINGIDVTHHPINKRKVNIVFQNYALFPHMNVFNNVAYSLMLEKRPISEIKQKTLSLLESFDLTDKKTKFPHELSGGQQQRVAIARAIINEPDVLLLDEPLAALDYKLREKLLIELVVLQDKLSTTFVYITHDQTEALTVADKMAIMNVKGEIEQIGTPQEIYEFPATPFVAEFVGSTNIFKGTYSQSEDTYFCSVSLLSKLKSPKHILYREGETCMLSVRPEKIYISKTSMTGFANSLTGQVESIVYYGRSTLYHVKLNNDQIIQVFEQNEDHFPQEEIDYDDTVFLYWQVENSTVFME